jgi:hypothetical protein
VLAAELLPFARSVAARCPDPALLRLLPARWTRFWGGQLYEEERAAAPGGGWRQEQEEGLGGGGDGGWAAPRGAPAEDGIEEVTDEDDW